MFTVTAQNLRLDSNIESKSTKAPKFDLLCPIFLNHTLGQRRQVLEVDL